MTKHFQGKSKFFLFFIMAFVFMACEQEDRFVGAGIFDFASFNKVDLGGSAYTINSDSLRSDRSLLANSSTVVGVYDEPIFGKTKANFYTQVRLGNLNHNFGNNPVVDSVVLFIPAIAFQNADTLETQRILKETNYTLQNLEESCTVTDTTYRYEIRRLFRIDSVYGNTQSPMTLQVHRVTEPLMSIDSALYSNRSFAVGELFGSASITNQFYKNAIMQYSDADGTLDAQLQSEDLMPTMRVKLEGMTDFIQQNLVNQSSSSNVRDNASFVRNVLQGIRLSVQEENGFLLTINPTQLRLAAYYSYDNPSFVDTNGDGVHDPEEDCPVSVTKPRTRGTYDFIVGTSINSVTGAYNVFHSHITNTGGSIQTGVNNASHVYVQGMGGRKAIFRLDDAQLSALRDSVNQREWLITQAQIKLYPDHSLQGNLPLPAYLYAYNYTDGTLLPDYGGSSSTENISGFPFNQISLPYNTTDGHYTIRITEFVKNIIENGTPNKDLAIEMGNYLAPATAYYYTPRNAYFSNRIANPYRVILHGSHPQAGFEDKKMQLEVYYNKR
ncbi:MAG: DUF4270 domain-containing protein [Weeksellaceae bacterium]|nr:DUF4270 domain-containing protein [Weeksellaceae bacterium]